MSRLSTSYFEKLNDSLKNYERAIPFLIVDLDLVDRNIEIFRNNLKAGAKFRIVVKSLPSPELLSYIMDKMDSHELMIFHQPFLTDLSISLDEKADVLIGKPMPINTASYYYQHLPKTENNFNPYQQIQWLVDTKSRILEYIELAKQLGQKLRLNLEIDVGLHRGGFDSLSLLTEALELIQSNQEHVTLSGLMGYDPHIVKIPSLLRSQKKSLGTSNGFYTSCKSLIHEKFPTLWNEQLTFNGAGSPTLELHQDASSPLNDIAAGSCFVKPTTFDIPSLSKYVPASFIATPVLKKLSGTTIPGLEKFKALFKPQSFFIYGGYWKAEYVYPFGVKANSLFGESTNQTMVNTPKNVKLEVDDFVFLRPHQSEFVFLQFGKILVTRSGAIIDSWELLSND